MDENPDLHAEIMALQLVLVGLLRSLNRFGPLSEGILDETFRYADHVSEIGSVNLGGAGGN